MSAGTFLTIVLFLVLLLVIVRYVIPRILLKNGKEIEQTMNHYYQIARRIK